MSLFRKEFANVPIIPIFLSGLGKALPKGDPILVPFHVNVNIGSKLPSFTKREEFMLHIKQCFDELRSEICS